MSFDETRLPTCAACGRPILAGDYIVRLGTSIAHQDCDSAQDRDEEKMALDLALTVDSAAQVAWLEKTCKEMSTRNIPILDVWFMEDRLQLWRPMRYRDDKELRKVGFTIREVGLTPSQLDSIQTQLVPFLMMVRRAEYGWLPWTDAYQRIEKLKDQLIREALGPDATYSELHDSDDPRVQCVFRYLDDLL